jgi:hypothetical protein
MLAFNKMFFVFVSVIVAVVNADLILFPVYNSFNQSVDFKGNVTNPCPIYFSACGVNVPIPVRSTETVNMIDLFPTSEVCYRYILISLIENQPMLTTWGNLFNGSNIIAPTQTDWWTGSYTNGTRRIGSTCNSWTSDAGGGRVGDATRIQYVDAGCDTQTNVVCGCLRNSDSRSPSRNPTNPSHSPSKNPSRSPTHPTLPTLSPTHSPSRNPTNPSRSPSHNPSKNPSKTPSKNPSHSPSRNPTPPTHTPSRNPSHNPSKNPSRNPSRNPTQPTHTPSRNPSKNPSRNPSRNPTLVRHY